MTVKYETMRTSDMEIGTIYYTVSGWAYITADKLMCYSLGKLMEYSRAKTTSIWFTRTQKVDIDMFKALYL